MAFKLAFSTVACPDWSLQETAAKAAEWGYQGLELRTLGDSDAKLASDPAMSEPEKVKKTLVDANIEPVCLSTSVALHHRNAAAGDKAVTDVTNYMNLAAKIGCKSVRVFGNEIQPGEPKRTAIGRIAERIEAIMKNTERTGVQLLLENAGSFAVAKDWWTILSLVENPMVGLSWNLANSAAADARDVGGAVAASTLNQRIRLAKVKDANIGDGDGFLPLGEGNVGIKPFIYRLLGVGYEDYVCVEWDRLWLKNLAPAEEFLPQSAETINTWIAELDELKEKASKLQTKALKKTAAKARPRLKTEEEQPAETE